MPASSPIFIVVILIAVALAVLVLLHRRDRRLRRLQRGSLFEPSYELFQSYRVEQAGQDFPVLTGRYRDRDFHIDVLIDTLTFRRLPVLWLRVSLLDPLPSVATTDILVRAQNNEFYSPGNDLPFQLPVPPHWPDGIHAKTDDADRAPARHVLDRHIDFFALPEAKEMLVTPRGVRLVRLIEQGQRAEYMVLRIADFRGNQATPEMLKDLMDRTIALCEDVKNEAHP